MEAPAAITTYWIDRLDRLERDALAGRQALALLGELSRALVDLWDVRAQCDPEESERRWRAVERALERALALTGGPRRAEGGRR